MQHVVINACYGGFGLSEDAIARYAELKGISSADFYNRDIPRDDPALVQVVREMGQGANSNFSKLHIVEVPDGVEWHIEEYDGNEHVAENHRVWR